MKEFYSPREIECIVQKYWEEKNTFKVFEDPNKEKYYCLSMMPYPSGNLHMGHIRNYTIGDVIARYQRMLGKNVLHPIGWDAFGLPAENAAIQNNKDPSKWTYSNIETMKNQLKMFGFSYDWDREIITCHENYYHWEQWFFIQLYKKGLVYRKNSWVNWCPKDRTVLANEQVINYCCWRCDSKIEYKKIPQWFIKITDYAEDLLHELDHLTHWPEKVKVMQRNWIGKLQGMEISFKIFKKEKILKVFVTQLDTFMGITYIIINQNHELFFSIKKQRKKLIKERLSSSFNHKKEKLENKNDIFSELYAIHPLTEDLLPIWIGNDTYEEFQDVFAAVPGHNRKDWEFAKKNNLPIKKVIRSKDIFTVDTDSFDLFLKRNNDCILCNSGEFDGLDLKSGALKISDLLLRKGYGKYKTKYRLRDWGVSRQRYWGAPIPMLFLKNGDIVPVSDDTLPVLLSKKKTKSNVECVRKIDPNWINVIYKGEIAKRETDTFDTFVESSWYHIRFTCPKYTTGMINTFSANYWLPIDQYIGGIEHATMHLVYFRFYHKLIYNMGLVNCNEPAKKLLCQGMVLADSFYFLSQDKKISWISPYEIKKIIRNDEGKIIKAIDFSNRELVYAGKRKMSKSKKNGIDLNLMIKKYGADTIRLFIMFAAPVEASLEWEESGIIGINRFLKRVWRLVYIFYSQKYISLSEKKINSLKLNERQIFLRKMIHQTIINVTEDIDQKQSFNTAVSSIMKLVKILERFLVKNQKDAVLLKEGLTSVVKILYPFTPHICFFLWKSLGYEEEIDKTSWPKANTDFIKEEKFLIVIQINGKFRSTVSVPKNVEQSEIYEYVVQQSAIKKYLTNKNILKVVYIPKKILNLVTD